MIDFFVTDVCGRIKSSGICQREVLHFHQQFGAVHEGQVPLGATHYISGEFIKEDAPPPTYADLRRADYPPLVDQLDAVWKGGQAQAEMRSVIMAVKARYPKP